MINVMHTAVVAAPLAVTIVTTEATITKRYGGPRHDERRRAVTRLRSAVVIPLAIGALLSTACASTQINRILADPSHYRDRQVRVSGSVVDSYSFANRGAYRLGDESGQLWVVSDRGVPRKGARVTVQGTIREGFNLGTLGDRINLPAIGSGLVLMESSHKAGR